MANEKGCSFKDGETYFTQSYPQQSIYFPVLPMATWKSGCSWDDILMLHCVVRTRRRSLYRSTTRTVAAAGGEGKRKRGKEGRERRRETAEGTKE